MDAGEMAATLHENLISASHGVQGTTSLHFDKAISSSKLGHAGHTIAAQLWNAGATAMRIAMLLTLAVLVEAASNQAQAATEQGHMRLAQVILSCREQANVWYLQWTSLKCNAPNPPRDRCEPLMKNICDLVPKCEGARVYCIRRR